MHAEGLMCCLPGKGQVFRTSWGPGVSKPLLYTVFLSFVRWG